MGAMVAKPNRPETNQAKADADLAMEALQKSAEMFLADVQMGRSTIQNLGYKLAGGKLTDQEIRIIVQTSANVTSEEIGKAIDGIFSRDWQTVTKVAANALIPFLSGETPKPADRALNESWSKSFLVWENNRLVQYSLFIKRTNATSTGLLTGDTMAVLSTCVCRGVVAYESVDPQIIVFELSETYGDSVSQDDFTMLIGTIKKEMQLASELITEKRKLISGLVIAGAA